MMPRRQFRPFVRPAILEAVLLLTLAVVAAVTAVAGERMHCTALIEFGILSAIAAASAATLFARYAVQMCGLLTSYGRLEVWSERLRTLSYIGLGAYALCNGILDVVLPRRDDDPISYPGLVGAVVAVLVVTLVLETKYRVLQSVPSRSLFDSLSDDAFYVAVGVITLIALAGHIFAPTWWLDTLIDAIIVVLVGLRLRGFRKRSVALS